MRYASNDDHCSHAASENAVIVQLSESQRASVNLRYSSRKVAKEIVAHLIGLYSKSVHFSYRRSLRDIGVPVTGISLAQNDDPSVTTQDQQLQR
jgi:hypothetical protein